MAIASILGIHGVPRSGTSWLAQIFNASSVVALRFQPLFSYSFKDRIDLNSSTEQINLFFQQIWASDHPFINMKDPKIHKGYPEFLSQRHLIIWYLNRFVIIICSDICYVTMIELNLYLFNVIR